MNHRDRRDHGEKKTEGAESGWPLLLQGAESGWPLLLQGAVKWLAPSSTGAESGWPLLLQGAESGWDPSSCVYSVFKSLYHNRLQHKKWRRTDLQPASGDTADSMRSWPLDCGLDCGDGKEQVKLVIEERDETVFLVERFCLLVDRVHLDGMDAEFVGQAVAASEERPSGAPSPSLPCTLWSTARRARRITGTGCRGSFRAEDSGRFWKEIALEASV